MKSLLDKIVTFRLYLNDSSRRIYSYRVLWRDSDSSTRREATLSTADYLRYCYLTVFSQPAGDRPLYKAIYQKPIRSIVEIGVGNGVRTSRMFELVTLEARRIGEPIKYTGIDLFEARDPAQPGLSLKQAFRELRNEFVRLNLVPGDPHAALQRAANQLANTDLLVVSADQQSDSLTQAWRFLPRMIHDRTIILLERPGKKAGQAQFETIPVAEALRWAAVGRRQLRAA